MLSDGRITSEVCRIQPFAERSSLSVQSVANSIFARIREQIRPDQTLNAYLICKFIAIQYVNDCPVTIEQFIRDNRMGMDPEMFARAQMVILERINFNIDGSNLSISE